MATLQVRDIDNTLYASLKKQAAQQHRSLSQEVIKILEANLCESQNKAIEATQEFLSLSNAWVDERSADTIIKEIRTSRKSSSRFGVNNVLFD